MRKRWPLQYGRSWLPWEAPAPRLSDDWARSGHRLPRRPAEIPPAGTRRGHTRAWSGFPAARARAAALRRAGRGSADAAAQHGSRRRCDRRSWGTAPLKSAPPQCGRHARSSHDPRGSPSTRAAPTAARAPRQRHKGIAGAAVREWRKPKGGTPRVRACLILYGAGQRYWPCASALDRPAVANRAVSGACGCGGVASRSLVVGF